MPPNVTSEHPYASIENTCLIPTSWGITVSSQVMSLDLSCASKISASLHLKTVFRQLYMMKLSWKFARKFRNFDERSRILSNISVEGNNGQDKSSLMNGARCEEICSDIKINSTSEQKKKRVIFIDHDYLCGFIQCPANSYTSNKDRKL